MSKMVMVMDHMLIITKILDICHNDKQLGETGNTINPNKCRRQLGRQKL